MNTATASSGAFRGRQFDWPNGTDRGCGALSYAAQNFSGAMARSARMTIVEAEEIVPIGTLEPNHVHLPGV